MQVLDRLKTRSLQYQTRKGNTTAFHSCLQEARNFTQARYGKYVISNDDIDDIVNN